MSNMSQYHNGLMNLFEDSPLIPYEFAPFRELLAQSQLSVNVEETDDSHIVTTHVPGINRDNINIEFNNDMLTITIKDDTDETVKDRNFTRREIRSFSARRSLAFDNIDSANIKAALNDGVLTITLPKQQPTENTSNHIEIQ